MSRKRLSVSFIQNQFGAPEELKQIAAKNQQWEEIEDNIRLCQSLERVDVDNNQLRSLAPLFSLPHLSEVKASHNLLTNLSGIHRLLKLRQLAVAHNQLESLEAVSSLPELRVLIANNNSIKSLPRVLPPLLACLVVSHNQLTSLEGVEQCTQLTKLSASHNQITALPGGIVSLNKLSELRLNNNLITTLRLNGASSASSAAAASSSSSSKSSSKSSSSSSSSSDVSSFGQQLNRMKLLDLGNNRLGDLDEILSALKPMHFLRNLNLKGNFALDGTNGGAGEQEGKQHNAHFLHTSSSSSLTSPSLSALSAPQHSAPPPYFLSVHTALPLLSILDARKVAEHEIKYRMLKESSSSNGGRGSKKAVDLDSLLEKDPITPHGNSKYRVLKDGRVVANIKGVKKHDKKQVALPSLTDLEKGEAEGVEQKNGTQKKPSKRTKPIKEEGAAAVAASSSADSGDDSSPAAASSSRKKQKGELTEAMQQKNNDRKARQREKKAEAKLRQQLLSGGEGEKRAKEDIAEGRAKMPRMPTDAKGGKGAKGAKVAAPTPKGKRKREEEQPDDRAAGGKDTSKKKNKDNGKAQSNKGMGQSVAPQKSTKTVKGEKGEKDATDGTPAASPQKKRKQQQQKADSSPSSSPASAPASKKAKVESAAATAAASTPASAGVVEIVRPQATSSFSVDALESAFAKADHVGSASGSGW